MNERSQLSLLQALMELRKHYPHWRFGQLVSNVSGWADADLWDVEDERLLDAVNSHLEHLRRRDQVATR
jgi:hypothetical protein